MAWRIFAGVIYYLKVVYRIAKSAKSSAFILNYLLNILVCTLKSTHHYFGHHSAALMSFLSLPPANEVCEGYVFTGVCLSTGGCACHMSCPPWQPRMPPGSHACPPAATHTPPAAMHAPRQPRTPPGSHACPPGSHACPPDSHACPPGSHACPPAATHAPPAAMHAPRQPRTPPRPIQEIYIFTAETHFLHLF